LWELAIKREGEPDLVREWSFMTTLTDESDGPDHNIWTIKGFAN